MSIANLKPLIPGKTWLTGSGAPNNQFGYKTQFYLNEDNGDIFEKVETLLWVKVGSINSASATLVASVNGKTGIVILSTTDIAEGANQYFTATRAKSAAVIDSTAGGQLDQAPSVHATNELVTNSVASEAAARSAADALLIPLTQKGAANGVATLDVTGKIPSDQIPPTAITSVTVVATIAERDALTVGEGDFCVVTDTNQTFIYNGTAWVELIFGASVISVNGFTGAVSLSTSHIDEGSRLYYTDSRAKLAAVINSSTGSETDKAMSVSAAKMFTSDSVQTETLARIAADALLIPLTQKAAVNGVATLGADGKVPSSQLPTTTSPVTSVNSKIGDVVLATGDIAESGTNYYFTTLRARNAAVVNSTAGNETDQAPSVSSIKAYIAALPSGVTSVNGQTGAATITAAGIGALPTTGGSLTGPLSLNETNELRFADADSSNYVGFKAATDISINKIWTLPSIDGTNGQVLTTNGSGLLSWTTTTSSVTSVNGLTGAVVLTTTNINEGTNLYFTDSRARNAIVGAASSIVSANLTASKALISDGSGKVSTSTVTSTELSYLSGVTSAIQTQIDAKLSTSGGSMTGHLTMSAQNELRFADADSSNYVGFKAPSSISSDKIWTLPSTDGTNGQLLTTNGSGVLSWTTGGGATVTSVNGQTGAVVLTAASIGAVSVDNFSLVIASVQDAIIAETNARIVSTPSFQSLTLLSTSVQEALAAEANTRATTCVTYTYLTATLANYVSKNELSITVANIQDAIVAEATARVANALSASSLTLLSTAVQEALNAEASARIAEIKWYSGSTSPSSSQGKQGDFYMDISSKQIWVKADSVTWNSIGLLV